MEMREEGEREREREREENKAKQTKRGYSWERGDNRASRVAAQAGEQSRFSVWLVGAIITTTHITRKKAG